MILGAGLEQIFAINEAKSLGYYVVTCDGNPNAPGLKISDKGIPVDINDVESLIKIGKEHHINGVMTHAVEIPHVVAQVAKELGLPGIDPDVAERARNKFKRISCLSQNNIHVAKFKLANSLNEAKEIAKSIGFPCVLKPIDNAGARGVQKVSKIEEVELAYKDAVNHAKSEKDILVEEYLDGMQISTESLVFDNKIITTGYGYRNYSRNEEFAPYFVEDGIDVPSKEFGPEKDLVLRDIENAIKAIGINWGVAKGDILVKDNKVYIIEMAARTSGGWFCTGTQPIATGVKILRQYIRMSVGDPISLEELKPSFYKASCQRYIIPNKDGIFQNISGFQEAINMPNVRMSELFNPPKLEQLIRKATNHAERYGMIITDGKNLKEAIENCENAMKKIQIIVK